MLFTIGELKAKAKTGIFAHRAMVNQAHGGSVTRRKLNIFGILNIEKIIPFCLSYRKFYTLEIYAISCLFRPHKKQQR